MVFVEQIYTGCLSEAAYYVESEGEAVIIDPLRDVQPYIDMAEKRKAKIMYVFETHFHADFVSGHFALSKQTGAPIVYGPEAKPDFKALVAQDGQEFKIGKAMFTVLHTPGHTMESSCFVLTNEEGKQQCVFTGDTLFIGDVGRPDLAQKAANLTQEQLAEYLYNSLRKKVMVLPDDITVYPGHGAGSACGKKMAKQTLDTLANQKLTNYALRKDQTCEEFVKEITTGLSAPPSYFPLNVGLNKTEIEPVEEILKRGMKKLSVKDVDEAMTKAAGDIKPLIIDARPDEAFVAKHIPGSSFASIDGGQFGPWAATCFTDAKYGLHRAYIIVAEASREEEAMIRLARFGFDNPLGYLDGGMDAWTSAGKPTSSIKLISADDVAKKVSADPNLYIIDVRKPPEFQAGHYKYAVNIPLDAVNFPKVDKTKDAYCYCLGGYRGLFFVSTLMGEYGFPKDVYNIQKGLMGLEKCEATAKDIVSGE